MIWSIFFYLIKFYLKLKKTGEHNDVLREREREVVEFLEKSIEE